MEEIVNFECSLILLLLLLLFVCERISRSYL